jgi:hypothetical protein
MLHIYGKSDGTILALLPGKHLHEQDGDLIGGFPQERTHIG